MKSVFIKNTVMFLALVLMLSLLSGCGSKEVENIGETGKPEPVASAPVVTLIADGRQITIEDTAGKTLQQLLVEARITLDAGDRLVISPEQVLDSKEIVISVEEETVETGSKPTEPESVEPDPTEPESTEPKPTDSERTVVSVEVYEDCDGSGHGVKVITYSDGTQEEVYF